MLSRKDHVAAFINAEHKNPEYITDYKLPYNLSCTTDPELAMKGASYIIHAIPVQASFDYLQGMKDLIPPDVPIVNTSKGLDCNRLMLMR